MTARAWSEHPFLVVERGMFESQAENLQRKVRESVFNTPKEVDTAVAAVRTLAAAWPPCGYVFGLYRAWAAL